MERLINVTFTSSGFGTLNGNGGNWWGAVEYLKIGVNRPRLLHIYNSSELLFQYLLFKDSPRWTVDLSDVARVEIHHCDVDARRDNRPYHDLFDLTAFNTDGFDVSGRDIHIHDVNIWNVCCQHIIYLSLPLFLFLSLSLSSLFPLFSLSFSLFLSSFLTQQCFRTTIASL